MSWTIESGVNYFDGDMPADYSRIIPTSSNDISFGSTFEYAMTPVWGLALDFYHFPLVGKNNAATFSTVMNTGDLNATINFTKLIFPKSKSKVTFSGAVGLGLAYYNFNVTPASSALPKGTDRAGSAPVTFYLEYDFIKSLAIGAKVHYRAYTKDNLEGIAVYNYHGVTNDYVASGGIYLRYKFNAVKKTHMRNTTVTTVIVEEGLNLAKQLKQELDQLRNRVDTMDTKVNKLTTRVDKIELLLSNDGPDSDSDGVPDHRDLEMNTPPNTPVDFWGKKMNIPASAYSNYGSNDKLFPTSKNYPMQGSGAEYNPANDAFMNEVPAVYFGFDQIDLDGDALVTISKIAKRMIEDQTVMLEVRGFCDYVGGSPYNDKLSKRRSDRVKSELVKVWKISPDRIIANGKGRVLEPRIQYRPSRRCEFYFSK